MGEIKMPALGIEFLQEAQTAQIAIVQTTNAMTWAFANNIGTATFAAVHGITSAYTAGSGATPSTLPNYYFLLGGTAMTGLTGTGILQGPIFRILSIPSTTTLTFYTTVTAATSGASTTFQPVFLPPNIPLPASGPYTGGPTLLGVIQPAPFFYGASCNIVTGANCTVQYSPSNWAGSTILPQLVYDSTTGNTPSTAPTVRTLLPVSSAGQFNMMTPGTAFLAASTVNAGTTFVSVLE
jgi:hypothetical protein